MQAEERLSCLKGRYAGRGKDVMSGREVCRQSKARVE